MKDLLWIFACCLLLSSCGTSKFLRSPKVHINESSKEQFSSETEFEKANAIVNYAMGFLGTRYKYGGTTKRGMDCSGLVYMAFLNAGDLFLPRTSSAMAKEGQQILPQEARRGDLVFFHTGKIRKGINHMGLVVTNDKEGIKFIHSSTSRGVMISSLAEPYWNKAFAQARRIRLD